MPVKRMFCGNLGSIDLIRMEMCNLLGAIAFTVTDPRKCQGVDSKHEKFVVLMFILRMRRLPTIKLTLV